MNALRSLRDFIDEGGQEHFNWQRRRGLQQAQSPNPQVSVDGLQGCDQVRQELGRAIVTFVKRQTGDRSLATRDPFTDQRGFTEPGGRRDEGLFTAQTGTLVQTLDQAGDNLGPGWRDIELDGQDWRRHRSIILTNSLAMPTLYQPAGPW